MHARSYPLLNRLHALKVFLDDTFLNQGCLDASLTADRMLAFRSLLQRYASPHHFPPMLSGFTLAIAAFKVREFGWESVFEERKLGVQRLVEEALQDLYTSQQMYTMRRKHYEVIADLYYLYDDFNDRAVHFNHALQMGGAEVTSFLIRCLHGLRNELRAAS